MINKLFQYDPKYILMRLYVVKVKGDIERFADADVTPILIGIF